MWISSKFAVFFEHKVPLCVSPNSVSPLSCGGWIRAGGRMSVCCRDTTLGNKATHHCQDEDTHTYLTNSRLLKPYINSGWTSQCFLSLICCTGVVLGSMTGMKGWLKRRSTPIHICSVNASPLKSKLTPVNFSLYCSDVEVYLRVCQYTVTSLLDVITPETLNQKEVETLISMCWVTLLQQPEGINLYFILFCFSAALSACSLQESKSFCFIVCQCKQITFFA